ncbi:MAG: hypothetical protein OEM63_09740, partial [Gammaproteobacteria bacterium]|nr:hypothetical protein [Gammaproteobacteria bacterium]
LAENSWLSLSAMTAETDGIIRDNETILGRASIDHFFDPVGVRLGGGYWGNADILDSRDLTAAIYVRGNGGSVSLDYEKRRFEFDLQSDLLRGRTAKFSADGWGLSSRLALGERVNLFLGGMSYDYSRNLRVQPDIDVLAFVSNSRLSMINNLIDSRLSIGMEIKFGLRRFDLTTGRWQTAVDGSRIDSYSVGFLTPVSDRVDAEFRLSLDESENYGTTTAFSFHVYYFGGT